MLCTSEPAAGVPTRCRTPVGDLEGHHQRVADLNPAADRPVVKVVHRTDGSVRGKVLRPAEVLQEADLAALLAEGHFFLREVLFFQQRVFRAPHQVPMVQSQTQPIARLALIPL